MIDSYLNGTRLAQFSARQAAISLVDFRWPFEYRTSVSRPRHVLALSLSPPPPASRARFAASQCDEQSLGDILFVPSNETLEAACMGGRQRSILCEFDASLFARDERTWTAEVQRRSLDLRCANVRAGLCRLAQEIGSLRPGTAVIVESLVQMLAIDVDRALNGEVGDAGPESHHRVTADDVESSLRAFSDKLPTVADLAVTLGISSRHLVRIFKEHRGETIRARLQREARSRAEAMLEGTALPIKVIAYKLGFHSPTSFSTAFRNMTGESPRQYRYRRRR